MSFFSFLLHYADLQETGSCDRGCEECFCEGTGFKSASFPDLDLNFSPPFIQSPWQELDLEEMALSKSRYGGLGFDEDSKPISWYGGKILFHGKLHDVSIRGSKEPVFKLTLEPAELGPSYMFARRFGSKHFFRLKLTKLVQAGKKPDLLLDYLRRPLIICGSVFRAFFAKDSNVFYVKTNEMTDGESINTRNLVPDTMSFLEFLNWHNPIELNNSQVRNLKFLRTLNTDIISDSRLLPSLSLDLGWVYPIRCQDLCWNMTKYGLLMILVCIAR